MSDVIPADLIYKDKDGVTGRVVSLSNPDIANLTQAFQILYSLFPTYSASENYAVGQYRIYNGAIYKCVQANGPATSLIVPGTNTAVWQKIPTVQDIISELSIFDLCPDGAAQHNALYRGKDITADFESGKFSENVANGTFKDIFPGDYIQKTVTVNGVAYSAKWIVGDCDYHYHYGDVEVLTHHVLAFPDICLGNSYMNPTNVTTGSYKGSYMWTTVIPQVDAGLLAAFTADHLVYTRQRLGTAINANAASTAYTGWAGVTTTCEWTQVLACTMNERMVIGRHAAGSFFDGADNVRIVAAFAHSPYIRYTDLAGNHLTWWLRDVVSSAFFAFVGGNGGAGNHNASQVHGVRPFCLIR